MWNRMALPVPSVLATVVGLPLTDTKDRFHILRPVPCSRLGEKHRIFQGPSHCLSSDIKAVTA